MHIIKKFCKLCILLVAGRRAFFLNCITCIKAFIKMSMLLMHDDGGVST